MKKKKITKLKQIAKMKVERNLYIFKEEKFIVKFKRAH